MVFNRTTSLASVRRFTAILLFLLAACLLISQPLQALAEEASTASSEEQPPPDAKQPGGGDGDSSGSGDGTPAPTPLPDDATLRKMKVAQLKAILARKGPDAACLACTSRSEYVDRIRETADWPDVTPSPSPTHPDPTDEELRKMFAGGKDSPDMQELRKKLLEAGIGGAKIFTKDDLDKMGDLSNFKEFKGGEKAGAAGDAPKSDDGIKADL